MSLPSRTDSVPETVSDDIQSATTIRAPGRNRTSPQTDSVTPRPLQLISPHRVQLNFTSPIRVNPLRSNQLHAAPLAWLERFPYADTTALHTATINNTQHRSQPYEITDHNRQLSGPSRESASGNSQERTRITTGRVSGAEAPHESAAIHAARLRAL